MAITNFTCTEMAIIFLEIAKLLQVRTLCFASYAKDTIVGACHRTSDGQEHKIIGSEQDTIFDLRVSPEA